MPLAPNPPLNPKITRFYVPANTCLTRGAKTASPAFQIVTTPTDAQHRALQLLQQITV